MSEQEFGLIRTRASDVQIDAFAPCPEYPSGAVVISWRGPDSTGLQCSHELIAGLNDAKTLHQSIGRGIQAIEDDRQPHGRN